MKTLIDLFKSSKRVPADAARNEALKFPNGWVYELDKAYDSKDEVPPSAIKGAWKVNDKGRFIGDFIVNPNYVPK